MQETETFEQWLRERIVRLSAQAADLAERAEKLQGEDVVYRMAGMSVDSGNVAEDAFTLPDGTVLHEGALDGTNR